MLRSLKGFEDYTVSATDGDIGVVTDFLLDDDRWVIRHLVVNTLGHLGGRHDVLVSPISFRLAEESSRHFYLALSIDKIKNSPNVDTAKPVSRQNEVELYGYYGYPYYWGGVGIMGMGGYPPLFAPHVANVAPAPSADDPPGDAHLRSAQEIRGYHVQGSDGAIGHIEDFIVDDKTWEVRYLVIDTSNWWMGKKVLVAPHWASRVSWEERKVHMNIPRDAIKSSPEWDASAAVNREYEARLQDHYGRSAP